MNKDIINRNNKGKLHGYQERYLVVNYLWYKCFYYNGVLSDYEEYYSNYDRLSKRFFI